MYLAYQKNLAIFRLHVAIQERSYQWNKFEINSYDNVMGKAIKLAFDTVCSLLHFPVHLSRKYIHLQVNNNLQSCKFIFRNGNIRFRSYRFFGKLPTIDTMRCVATGSCYGIISQPELRSIYILHHRSAKPQYK